MSDTEPAPQTEEPAAANDPQATPSRFPALVVGKDTVGFEHLNDFVFTFDTDERRGVTCTVQFSTHCFSDRYDQDRHAHHVIVVDERRQQRCFDQDRYELSKGLKALIEALPVTKVYYQTHESNFAIITMADGREYRVYFNVRRSSGKNTVRLYVESAYAPDAENFAVTPKRARSHQPVRFKVLVDKVLKGEKLKFARR